jgi:hypothetical protein
MAYFDSYDQIGQAEDVQDAIYNISPIDTPVISMSRTIQATGKIHEWHQDALIAAASNKAVEGADAPTDVSVAAVNKSNYCQILTKSAEIAGTLETVDKYGRDSEVAYQLELRYGELANDEELAVCGAPGGTRQTGAAGDGTTAREMASLMSQLAAGVIEDGVGYTTVANLEAGLTTAHQSSFTAGGNPAYMVVDPTNSLYISDFAKAAGRQRDIRNEKRLVSVIDLWVNNFGELDVVIDRNSDDAIKLLDFNYLATPVLRPTSDWELAKVGDSIRYQILKEGTFAVLNNSAHAAVDNVPTNLTVS